MRYSTSIAFSNHHILSYQRWGTIAADCRKRCQTMPPRASIPNSVTFAKSLTLRPAKVVSAICDRIRGEGNTLLRDWARRLVAVILSIRCFGGAAPPRSWSLSGAQGHRSAHGESRESTPAEQSDRSRRGSSTLSLRHFRLARWCSLSLREGRRRLGRGASRPAD